MAPSRGNDASQPPTGPFLNPDNAVTGGLRNMIEATVTAARYEEWDFKGKAKPVTQRNGTVLSGRKFALHLVLDDIDDGGKPEDIYWPGRPIEHCVPNDDGSGFEFVKGHEGFPRDSELMQGIGWFIECGAISKTDIEDDPSFLVGKRCFWERKSALWATEKREGKDGPDNLMPTKFIEDVGASGGKGKSSSRAAASSSSKSGAGKGSTKESSDEPDTEITDLAIELVREALDDLPSKQKTISREDLGSEVLAIMLKRKDIDKSQRKAVGALFEDDEFLEQNSGKRTWLYDSEDGEVTKVK